MSKTKIKKWTRRILIGLLISVALSIVAPVVMNTFVENTGLTAYAAECNFTPGAEKQSQCELIAGQDKCPDGYTLEAGSNTVCKVNTTSQKVDQQTLRVMNFLISLQNALNRVIWPVLVMIGGLTDNSLLFGNGMEDRLREIWIPIRNIVNILFVVALVGIALYNVLGIGDENSNYSIKAILPKIIVGIIVVNFSFLGIKVFLDGINVLTTAIFALPNQISSSSTLILDPKNSNDQTIIDRYCRSMEGKDYNEVLDYVAVQKETEDQLYRRIAQSEPYDTWISVAGTDTKADIIKKIDAAIALPDSDSKKMPAIEKQAFLEDIEEHQKGQICELVDGTKNYQLTDKGQVFLSRWNARNASLAMALGLSKIVLYSDLSLDNLQDLEKIVINTVLSLMMYLLFAASFIALFVVLLGRLVVMWLAIALSPVLLLGMAIPAVKESVSGFGDITNQFVKNAIAPLGIALSLSIGWIMLKALQGLNSFYSGESISFSATKGIPVVGLTTLQDLIVGVGTLAVIWLGVFTAASNTIAAPVTDWMKSGLSRAGQWIGTLPLKHAPIFHIDLPGVSGSKENYTGTQVMEAINQLTTAKEPSKLANLLTNKTRVNPNDLKSRDKYKDGGSVLNWLKNAKSQNMSAKDLKVAMNNLRRNNVPAWNDLRDNHKDVFPKVLAMTKARRKKDMDKARKDLLEHNAVSGASGLTNKQGTAPKVSNVSKSTKITVNSKETTIGDEAKAGKINGGMKNLAAELGAAKPEKDKIQPHLTAIRGNLPPGADAKTMRQVLSPETLAKLKEVYKTDPEIDKALVG